MAFSQDATVKVDFATSFDGRALNQGTKQVDLFTKALQKTGKQLLGLYSVNRILRYSKQAVAGAFAETKAQAQLANQLKNVGLGYATITSEKWIQDFQNQTGILDDELRPAYAQLARVTKDLSQTQELMTMAFDVAGGAGIDYASAVDILSQAYVGNYRGLKQLNLGVSQAKLQTMTAGEVFTLMGDKFRGAGDSMITAGDKLNVMFATLKDNVGAAIIKGLADDGNIQSMNDMTKALNDMLPVVTFIAKAFKEVAKFGAATIGLFDSKSAGWQKVSGKWPAASMIPKSYYENLNKGTTAIKDSVKALTTTSKILKANTAQQAKTVALQKLSNLLRQAQKVFDNEAITLAAAAQGKLTEEERARLKLKQDIYDLEAAIADDNVDAATKIAATLVQDAQYLGQITGFLTGIQGVTNPFADWLKSLQEILATLGTVVQAIPFMSSAILPNGFDPRYAQGKSPADMYPGALSLSYGSSESDISSARYQAMADYYAQQTSTAVNIQINPAVAGLINVIQDTSASGTSPTVSRINTSYIA